MIFNDGMSIWILAILVIVATALAGWRQGGIRAAIAFGGILFATLLCGLVGKIFHVVLPWFGTKNPLMIWALSPLFGFILVSIIFSVIAFNVHRQADVYYRRKSSDLRLALWERLNTRLGICVGVLNGALYFVLISFLLFNLTYLTTQVSAGAQQPSVMLRLVNSLGNDLEASGLARTATAVGTLPPVYYQYADLAGFLMQNPQTASRLVEYPALTSLWQRDDMQELVADNALTNALASGASIGEIMNEPSVQNFLKNKDLNRHVNEIITTNMADLMDYLKTGKSATYDGIKVLGNWSFNAGVSAAWLRQSQPQIPASQMRAIRTLWTEAYAQTTLLITADNQVFVRNFPRFEAHPQPNQPPFTPENWNGDWSQDDASYTLHLTLGGQDKFLTATTTDGLRLSVKDGRNLLIFDHAD
jgi:phosphate/sulfate permease